MMRSVPRRLVSTASLLTAAILLWELLLVALDATGEPVAFARILRHLGIDAVLCTVLLVPSLWLASTLAARWRTGPWLRLAEVSVATLTFLLLLVPAAFVRELAVLALFAPGAGAATPETAFLCASGPAGAALEPGFVAELLRVGRDALLLQAPVFPVLALVMALRTRKLREIFTVRRAALAGMTASIGVVLALTLPDTAEVSAVDIVNGCPAGAPVRVYNVSAIHQAIPLNRWGDFDPGGYMYVLDERLAEVQQQAATAFPDRVSIGLRRDAIQPLVIRGNLGECVQINFTNRLNDGPVSISFLGLAHTVENAGGRVGFNPDTFAAPGQTLTYRIPLPSDPLGERAYYFHSGGASRQRTVHGLFGVLVAEPAGSQHLNTETGQPLTVNDWEAMIVPPTGPAFREQVLLYHEVGDETFEGLENANGDPLPRVSEFLDIYRPGGRALNYRSEPFHRRMQIQDDDSMGYGSYMFGDPATPIPRSYLGDPSKTRLVHAGAEVFHVHHLHGGATRWPIHPKAQPSLIAQGFNKDPTPGGSTRRDAQSIGPGITFNLEHECGAGGCQQGAGEFLFHCHIGHHYLAGMWSFWRVFDTRQPDLAPLPGRAPPPEAVNSLGLIGQTVEGKTLLPAAEVTDPTTQQSLEEWIERQLPPPGVRLDKFDATVWNWARQDTPEGPLYLGEPEDATVWANFRSPTPGVRPEIRFNPSNGRYAWPLLRPHLAQRPPFSPAGHTGAPWLGKKGSALRPDGLCPNDEVLPDLLRTTRLYPISAISTPIQVTPTEVDEDGQLFVLNDLKQDILSGRKRKEPLVIRTNAGDCANILLTNELKQLTEGGEPFKTNIHIHFVQFDTQASDGVISGFSFEQAIYPFSTENRTLTAPSAPGATEIQVTNVDRLRPGIWIGVGLGEGMCTPPGGGPQQFCTEVRRISEIRGLTLVLDESLELAHAAGQAVGVEFVNYNWYSDVDTGTVFFHTHVDFNQWHHGLFGMHIIEPPGSTWHDPTTGEEIRAGAIADIHAPFDSEAAEGIRGPFREAAIALSEAIAETENQFVTLGEVNLRAQPLEERPGDPAFAFSSVRHGDPLTPIPRAYVGDPMIIRLLGVHEFVGGFRAAGVKVPAEESVLLGATQSDAVVSGISERSNLPVLSGDGTPVNRAGDYLYYNTLSRMWQGGAWGFLRYHDTLQPDLRPLPGLPLPPSEPGFPQLQFTGQNPPPALNPGQPCPPGAPTRSYAVRVLRGRILYGDQDDSNGVVFRLEDGTDPDDRPEVTEPLVLRVNEGECLEISLRNFTDERASFHVGEMEYDPLGSYGGAIGFNPDSTVAPGASRLYRFFARSTLDTPMVINLAQPLSGAHGGYAAVIVEPPGSIYRHPVTGAELRSGVVADIIGPQKRFREAVLLFADEDDRIGQNTMPYPRDVAGFTGINYSAASFDRRDFEKNPTGVFDSRLWGDPRHVLNAHAGDRVILRVGQPYGEQLHVFAIEGHTFKSDDIHGGELPYSRALAPGVAFYADLINGAGGVLNAPGDYLFLDERQPFLEAGLWGILRVHAPGQGGILPLTATLPPDAGTGGGADAGQGQVDAGTGGGADAGQGQVDAGAGGGADAGQGQVDAGTGGGADAGQGQVDAGTGGGADAGQGQVDAGIGGNDGGYCIPREMWPRRAELHLDGGVWCFEPPRDGGEDSADLGTSGAALSTHPGGKAQAQPASIASCGCVANGVSGAAQWALLALGLLGLASRRSRAR